MPVIEVCERANDFWYGLDYDEDGNPVHMLKKKYHAQIKDHPDFWGQGASPAEAIGDLILSHKDNLGLDLVSLGVLPR